jgi:choline dehydrogenase-like flavoprotein
MLVVGMGREASVGQFRLGKGLGDTPLRVKRTDGKEFFQDPVYDDIKASLDRLADILRSPKDPTSKFFNPFLNDASDALKASSISLTHPLGGCRMAEDATKGVVDEFGRVFDKTKHGTDAVYKGLYIADAAIMPTALGVNPSLTISALALRIVDNIIKKM